MARLFVVRIFGLKLGFVFPQMARLWIALQLVAFACVTARCNSMKRSLVPENPKLSILAIGNLANKKRNKLPRAIDKKLAVHTPYGNLLEEINLPMVSGIVNKIKESKPSLFIHICNPYGEWK